MPRRMYSGNAVATTLNGAINSTTSTIVVADASGYPDGSTGNFWIVIDRGLSTEEKVLCNDTTGNTITAVDRTNSANRDDTSNFSHSNAAPVEHCYTADDADDANAHTYDTARDDHTQYLNTARHDIEARHTYGAAYGTPDAPASTGDANAAGSGGNPAREDHIHKGVVANDAWTPWTPTAVQGTTNFSPTNNTGRYIRNGRTVTAFGEIDIQAGTGEAGQPFRVNLPVNAEASFVGSSGLPGNGVPLGVLSFIDETPGDVYMAFVELHSTTHIMFGPGINTIDGSRLAPNAQVSAGDSITFGITYEAAS